MQLPPPALGSGAAEYHWVNPGDKPDWDKLVLRHDTCSVFHSRGWAQVLCSSYQHNPLYLVRLKEDQLQAVLPIMEISSSLTGKRGVSLPFTDSCDPLFSAKSDFAEMFQLGASAGRNLGWRSLETKVGSEWAGLDQPALEFFGHSIDLKQPEDRLFAGLSSTLRNEIRKAERSSVEVIFASDLEGIKLYYALHCLTRRRHGLPPQPISFFENIQTYLLSKGAGFVALAFLQNGAVAGDKAKASTSSTQSGRTTQFCNDSGAASKGRTPIAGAVFLDFGKHAVYKFSASDESRNQVPAGKLALWRAIQWYKWRGLESLDLGRTSLENTGLRRYKLSWGAAERRIRNLKYHLRSGKFVTKEDKVYGWYNRFFGLCPPAASRTLGRFLYRHLD
jgi:hypothetical protein